MPRQTFFPTLKTRPEFLKVKKLGLSWASTSFIIQGLINIPNSQASSVSDAEGILSNSSSNTIIINGKKQQQTEIGSTYSCSVFETHVELKEQQAEHILTNEQSIDCPYNVAVQENHRSLTLPRVFATSIISQQHLIKPADHSVNLNIDPQSSIQENDCQQVQIQITNQLDSQHCIPVIIKVGYIATKKLGNAVARNRAKRRMRELCKAGSDYFQNIPAEYVIIARHPILERSFDQLLSELAWTLKHLNRMHNEQS